MYCEACGHVLHLFHDRALALAMDLALLVY
jgi:hypothetical protein